MNAFYTEIEDGRQKWQENNCWEKSLIDSAGSLWVKNFVKIALSGSVFEINVFLPFLRRNSRWPPKVAGKRFLGIVVSRFCR